MVFFRALINIVSAPPQNPKNKKRVSTFAFGAICTCVDLILLAVVSLPCGDEEPHPAEEAVAVHTLLISIVTISSMIISLAVISVVISSLVICT